MFIEKLRKALRSYRGKDVLVVDSMTGNKYFLSWDKNDHYIWSTDDVVKYMLGETREEMSANAHIYVYQKIPRVTI